MQTYLYLIIFLLICIIIASIVISHSLCKSSKVDTEPTIIYVKPISVKVETIKEEFNNIVPLN